MASTVERKSVSEQEDLLRSHLSKMRKVLSEAKDDGVLFRVTGGTRRPYQVKASIK